MNRRDFTRTAAAASAFVAVSPFGSSAAKNSKPVGIPLGAPVFEKFEDPDGWINALNRLGYRAAYTPVSINDDDNTIKAFADAARKSGIIIAEVGAWSNPISPDETQRKDAYEKCIKSLHLADQLVANYELLLAETGIQVRDHERVSGRPAGRQLLCKHQRIQEQRALGGTAQRQPYQGDF